ncbi:SusD/RagB family nutrient-binding outer membrane lipoprotein [Leptobacterium flavescens]|uniref:SusD/RagB family nutrient-binding outer membrane lipoprotein n=1 Tax=Leptobacterium flavescens TaxID=472055 RepID=A0A6P0USS5_9FLAO|nr:SusD/RagB family nutrient-binding outer membrane lipoprotein [Leptobacterium flavescens]NER13913.1 SusD/RagB family nutrient-binding outer membrane lipoprotein [Leptobacterium flavescens]
MKIRVFVSIFLAPLFITCNEFEEINANINEPTRVTADVLFPAAIRQTMTTMVTESFLLGNNIAQLTAKTLRTEVDSYNWNAFPTVWEGLFSSLTDVLNVEKLAKTEGNTVQEGAAIVWRCYIFATLTNAYGDIPYSEAIKGDTDNFTPVYDLQEDIYLNLLSELERAAFLLASGKGSVGGDILFNGDVIKWQKLANSLMLRLLMTANNQLPDAAERFVRIVSSGNIISSNEDNAVLTFLKGAPNQFPLIPLKTGDFDAVALSSTSYAVMLKYKDPRLSRYARPDNNNYNDPVFSGAINGSSNANCNKAGSRLGAQYFNDPAQVQASELGLETAKGIIMTYAEIEFLLAEAAVRGWINDLPKRHYLMGIKASMEYHQVNYTSYGWTDFDDFYFNSGVVYNKPADIWEQKWLSLYFTGLEPYFELRRWYFESGFSWDGIPFMGPACGNLNGDKLPLRFLYPGQEQSLNSVNYRKAVERMGGADDFNASTWLTQ